MIMQAGQLTEALDKLLALEKQTRNVRVLFLFSVGSHLPCSFLGSPAQTDHGNNVDGVMREQAADLASTSRTLIAIIALLHQLKEWDQLNAHLQLLSKKHGQLRQATQKMVEEAMTYLPTVEGKEKLTLIETLRDVTEGKACLFFLPLTAASTPSLLSKRTMYSN